VKVFRTDEGGKKTGNGGKGGRLGVDCGRNRENPEERMQEKAVAPFVTGLISGKKKREKKRWLGPG